MYIRNNVKLWLYDSGKKAWSQLPNCVYNCTTLQILYGTPTTIGGCPSTDPVNKLMSLTMESSGSEWIELFPPMPTKRCFVSAACAEAILIVAGGRDGVRDLTTVEVMHMDNYQWSTAAHLPEPLQHPSAAVCGNQIYMLGGSHDDVPTKSVYTCSVSALLPAEPSDTHSQRSLVGSLKQALSLSNGNSGGGTGVWSKLPDLPVDGSTCVSFHGQLLVVGGRGYYRNNPTTGICTYNPSSHSWNVIGHMKTARVRPFVVVLPYNQLMVVGGESIIDYQLSHTDSVEFVTLI